MTDRQAKVITFERLTVRCPMCHDGAIDSGGSTPWGTAICECCSFCGGTGRTTAAEILCFVLTGYTSHGKVGP